MLEWIGTGMDYINNTINAVQAIFECVWEGDIDLLDDLLDLPGAHINITWVRTLLMT